MLILIIVAIQVLLPAVYLAWLWRRPQPSRLNWLLQAMAAGSVLAFMLVVGNWAWTSMYLWGVFIVLFVVTLMRSFRRAAAVWRPFTLGDRLGQQISTLVELLVTVIFIGLTAVALGGYAAGEETVSLRFPLQDGVYHVGQGGDSPLINYHNVHPAQEYALDVGKLNAFGIRAAGLYPKASERYAIYGDTLYSPCAGSIREVVTGLPDFDPPESDPEQPAGNHIVFDCQGTQVVLAHMMRGSALVQPGMSVEAGVPVGQVGNSGNTSEPHLHIHAERDGEGVPMTFGGRFLVRNSLVW